MLAAPDFDAVHLDDISRYFGRRRALSHVTFSARRGEAIGLLGPNGAGKSTLLAVLSTLLRQSAGHVRYGDLTSDQGGDVLRGRIGLLGHDLFLYGDLTARENLEFFANLSGLAGVAERVTVSLAHARLADRVDDRVSRFSRGMRQRLALERALIGDPRLVLLDEPFTGLDDESTNLLTARLRGLRDGGAIVLMATHDFDTAQDVVTRSACLDRGRLSWIADGAAPLRERYRHTLQRNADAAGPA
jgi:ABC-type multidrug transport system ATPase subunit